MYPSCMLILLDAFYYILDCDSIFKTTGTHAPVYWQDDYLAETFEHLSVIKKTFSKEIATENPVDFDAFLSAQPLLFQRLKVCVLCKN